MEEKPFWRPGTIVLLNGTSSAGKSSLAAALQHIMDEPYLHTGIDHFLERMPGGQRPGGFIVASDGANPATADGMLAVFHGGALQAMRIGPAGYRILAGMYRAIAALSHAGVNVIVDDVIHDPRVLREAVFTFAELPALFVGVRCPLQVAERRERERGDRAPGGARLFHHKVHAHGLYDLEVDTSQADPMTCAAQIKAAIQRGQPCTAFAALARRMRAESHAWWPV